MPLGLCDSLLDDCDLQKTIPAKCFSAFAKWKEKEGKTATIFRLLQALCESDLIGTAEELIDKLHLSGTFMLYNHTECASNCISRRKEIQKLIEEISG